MNDYFEMKIIARSSNEQGRILRMMNGAVKSAIDAHGPITMQNYHSAAKRIYHTLKASKLQEGKRERARRMKHRALMLFE